MTTYLLPRELPLLYTLLKSRCFLNVSSLRSLIQTPTKLSAKRLSSSCSSSLENLASVGCSHSLAESVFLESLPLLRLISSFHFLYSLLIRRDLLRKPAASSAASIVYVDIFTGGSCPPFSAPSEFHGHID